MKRLILILTIAAALGAGVLVAQRTPTLPQSSTLQRTAYDQKSPAVYNCAWHGTALAFDVVTCNMYDPESGKHFVLVHSSHGDVALARTD